MSLQSHAVSVPDAENPLLREPVQNELTARLSDRPPLEVRVGALASLRQHIERSYRLGGAFKDETAPVNYVFGTAVFLLRNALKLSGLYRRGVRNAKAYRVVERTLTIPGLPAGLEGFRILHVSDFHLPRRIPAVATAMGQVLAGVEADLCVLTGDYRFGYFGPADHVVGQLRTILAGVRSHHGIVAVLGNHDTLAVGMLLERSGLPILYNEGILLRIGSASLWLCGIDEPHNYGCDRVSAAVAEAPAEACKILLAHSPERAAEAAAAGVNLYLAGHTHGGQIRLPVAGALLKNAACARDQVWGPWRLGDMAGYTTCGIGVTDVPVRFNCPPEAALLTLEPAPL